MQALYWHPVCESVLTLSLITPGWELDPSQHAGGWPLLSLQEAGPLSACCLVATGQHQCHHFIITQADSWTSLSKQEALSQSALHLHFNPTARLKEGPLSPDLWNGDICGPASPRIRPLMFTEPGPASGLQSLPSTTWRPGPEPGQDCVKLLARTQKYLIFDAAQ